jgi:hypothetical protein
MIRKTSLIAAASALSLLSALPTGAQTIAIVGGRILSQGPAGDIASGTVLIKGQYFHDKKVGTWLTTSADQSKKYELVYGPNGRVITQLWAAQ